ncbi:MAG: hypothetical protein AAF646_15990 [Pseudomonadota bacterium]
MSIHAAQTIAALDGGLAYHTRTLRAPPFAAHFGPLIDLRALGETDLSGLPCLMIPCRTNGARLAAHKAQLATYLEAGGVLVVMGETHPERFLDGVHVAPEPTNFWWWLEAGAELGVRIAAPDHPLMVGLRESDATWHIHGALTFDAPSQTLLSWDGSSAVDGSKRWGGAILAEQRRGAGQLVVTTLDPIYHHGSGFMPATTRFLERFLPALRAAL